MSSFFHNVNRVIMVLRKGPMTGSLMLVRFAMSKVQYIFARMASINGFLASLYFTFGSRKFYREHKAVLQGIVAFHKAEIDKEKTSSQLRRNIHRLEKGLIMRPRRDSFAANYIFVTVQLLKQAREGAAFCEKEIKWANDVLSEYFSVVSDTPQIAAARKIFALSRTENTETNNDYTPYLRKETPDLSISYNQLLDLFTRRRSVRWYLDRPIEKKLIIKAINAASLAPSACNRQPFRFHLLEEQAQAVKIAKIAMGTSGFSHNIPCLLVVIGDLSFYPEERDRHIIYIDGALASMQLMLALETLGLSSCPINWPDIEIREQEIQKNLKLKNYERPIMQISVGYADLNGGIAYSQKKDNHLLIR